jgi:hypothetical protein
MHWLAKRCSFHVRNQGACELEKSFATAFGTDFVEWTKTVTTDSDVSKLSAKLCDFANWHGFGKCETLGAEEVWRRLNRAAFGVEDCESFCRVRGLVGKCVDSEHNENQSAWCGAEQNCVCNPLIQKDEL